MQINEVIRKYRKQKKLTQEEMASKLGVTAPAVNKWESGASTPDISLLAPIARLLGITLDELLSFNETLSDLEVSNIIQELHGMIGREKLDVIYQKMVDKVREYPNAENLKLSLASMLFTQTLILGASERAKYDDWLQECLENLLKSDSESMKMRAADSLYAFFISRERYEDAEGCLEYYSDENPDKKRKLASIYRGTKKFDEAYKALEETLFSSYQNMSGLIYELYMVAVETENFEKAKILIEKESAFAELFEMGLYNQLAGKVQLAVDMKDGKQTLELLDKMLSSSSTLMDYAKSSLFEHMTFGEFNPAVLDMVISNQIKQYCEDDKYQFMRETAGWEDFKNKWCK